MIYNLSNLPTYIGTTRGMYVGVTAAVVICHKVRAILKRKNFMYHWRKGS
jgi:hypothetical protein